MKEKLPKKSYRWQPEIATSLIYWSLTFAILFCALIVQLELIKLNIYSISIGIIFLFFLWLGLQRKIRVTESELIIRALRRKNSRKIPIHSIEELSVGSMGLSIIQQLTSETILIRERDKLALINEIKKHAEFKGKIKGV